MSLQKSNECDFAALDRFLDEELSQPDANQLSVHLETCQTCRDYLETSAADSRSWADASSLLKTDSLDNEKFLTTTGLKNHDASSAIDAIISAFTPSEFPDHLGRIGIYEVTGVVGSGATGVVFKAIDPSLDRTVAIKVLLPSLTNSGTASKRFEREAKAAAAVLHPNVVPIHGVSNTNGLYYLVMAYVGGESLQKRLSSQGPLALAETLRVGAQIAAGLAAAHDQGLVHRDIKPANIILEDNVERVAITDFGLARAVDDASLTMEGIIAGTPRYMSPEQAEGKSVTQQTDLFSLGSVLYAISTGRPPFRAESSFGVMRKICEDQPLSIRDLNPDVPPWLAGTIEKLMSKSPDDRFQTAREVAGLLENGLAHVQHPTEVPLSAELKKLTQQRQEPFSSSKKAIAMITILLATLGILLAQQGVILIPGFTPQDKIDRRAFTSPRGAIFENAVVMEENGERILQVQLADEWFNVESIAKTPIESIFAHAGKNLRPKDVDRRMIEDLPALMKTMGIELGTKCEVELKNKKGATKKFELAITSEKRRMLFEAKKNFRLTGEMFRTDLEHLQDALEKQFAYYRANNVDLDAEIKRLTNKYPEGLDITQHGKVISQLMARFIDGHAGVEFNSKRSEHALPFLIEPINGRFVAFYEDRESFVDPKFPYLTKIDGIGIEELLENFKPTIAQGSPQYVLRHQLRAIRDLGTARELAGLPANDSIKLQLVGMAGETKQVEVFVAKNAPFYGDWPRRPLSGKLDGNLGYLRLNQMNSNATEEVKRWMPRFKDTDGLIIDVRDNGGGTREALIELAAHLMTPEMKPRVANVCKFRRFEDFGVDHLSSRYAYTAEQHGEREQKVIHEFMESFKPEWEPKKSEFSDWHFLVLSKEADDPTPVYQKPVVILMNEKCFSATDIFLGAFKGWPNVTLMGQPSGGGSAKSEDFKLPVSRFEVRCASMASFQPNGKLYDTNGVEPDYLVLPTPGYFLRGGTDDFLEQAIKTLKSKKN